MSLRVSAIIFQLLKVIMPEKCALLSILELNWNQRLGQDKIEHLSAQLQKRSFHVIERTRTSSKCQKMKKCTCKACKNTVFHCQISKFVETTAVPFGRAISVRQLPFAVLSDNVFWNRCICSVASCPNAKWKNHKIIVSRSTMTKCTSINWEVKKEKENMHWLSR